MLHFIRTDSTGYAILILLNENTASRSSLQVLLSQSRNPSTVIQPFVELRHMLIFMAPQSGYAAHIPRCNVLNYLKSRLDIPTNPPQFYF